MMEWISVSKRKEKQQWHVWFAWFPVVVKKYPDGAKKKVWLKNVLRCCKYIYTYNGIDCYKYYKKIKEKEKCF